MAEQSANKRLAKNTLLLYVRMALILGVSLYTSRVVLAALGFDDYGIYNVVGSIVTLFGFINLAMGNATSRFITYALGKGDKDNVKNAFNAAFIVHLLIAILIIILAETIGLWFLYNKMAIPSNRMDAAFWVYQFSIISCAASIIYVPFHATIIANERMRAFTYLSLIEALLKIGIAFLITIVNFDRLIFYAFLYLCVHLLNVGLFSTYCFYNFEEIRFKRISNNGIIKEMACFAGWSMIGNLSFVCMTQGQNILLNVFFGPVVNAARGIAISVQSAVKGFVTNFQMAINPQIIKSYAQKDFERLHFLIYTSSKLSFCLLWCLTLPIILESDTILHLWLKEVPADTSIFLRMIMLIMLCNTIENPISISNSATGQIRTYQMIEGGILLMILPVSYVALKIWHIPVVVFVVQLLFVIIAQIARFCMVKQKIKLSTSSYLKRIVIPCVSVLAVSFPVSYSLSKIMPDGLLWFLLDCITAAIIALICVYVIALNRREREFILARIKNIKRLIK